MVGTDTIRANGKNEFQHYTIIFAKVEYKSEHYINRTLRGQSFKAEELN
jgi:hypothetical protein